eukprot:TRINITY_DN37774_c0_g2_i1.p1 TRINITY_DN37774_c0_g2~~TRINITY_DN37774_c0_g2_i1.p1  ORF type:complete len:366 (-),score=32.97 TRINITY_DN37774_c0_g2_i1:235-1221(-)
MSNSPSFGQGLSNCPEDGLTGLTFAKDGDLLLASSWDGTVRIYDSQTQQLQGNFQQEAPVLGCEFSQSSGVAFSAGIDGIVRRIDVQGASVQPIGQHQSAVKSVKYFADVGVLYSGGWDQRLMGWDPRAMQESCNLQLNGRLFAMGAVWPNLVLGLSGRQICIYDVRQMQKPQVQRESSIKFQTRCIECSPNKKGYAVGSAGGKVGIEYYEHEDGTNYAFKCHRVKSTAGDSIHPVNAIAFHPSFCTFATGGGDATINMWDSENRKRLMTMPNYPDGIMALAFNRTGEQLAIGCNKLIGQGEQEKTPSQIFLRRMAEVEVQPKPRVQA